MTNGNLFVGPTIDLQRSLYKGDEEKSSLPSHYFRNVPLRFRWFRRCRIYPVCYGHGPYMTQWHSCNRTRL
jgi:hypothetical protein